MNVNASTQITFDTRTPPKFREQVRRGEAHQQAPEFGHAGVAEAVNDEALVLEEEQKKMHFYKVDKPTTSSGISTWILLSGQASTNKPPKKPTATTKNSTNLEDKIIKPIFKRKITTIGTTPFSSSVTTPGIITKKPTILVSSTVIPTDETTSLSSEKADKTTKLTKIASNSSKKVSRVTTAKPTKTTISVSSTTIASGSTSNSSSSSIGSTIAPTLSSKQEFVKVTTKSSNSSDLQAESKEGVLDLSPSTIDKKAKRPTSGATTIVKRKRNKNRKKKPIAEEKADLLNGTKISSKIKEKPFGTQIYNYLSREVMPTVGVGLVGLMVTAGLASYFLYPFGALRRSFEVDRKDKDGAYYYADEYSGGISEEEAIGKVIAGMPASNYFNTNARVHNSRNTYGLSDNNFNNMISSYGDSYHPSRFRNVDQRYMKGSVESLPLNSYPNLKANAYINHHKDTYDAYKTSQLADALPSNEPQLAVTTEYVPVTPAVVPEHGPRTIEEQNLDAASARSQDKVFIVDAIPAHAEGLQHVPRRRRRQTERRQTGHFDKDIDNEIIAVLKDTSTKPEKERSPISSSSEKSTSMAAMASVSEEDYTTAYPMVEKTESIFSLIRDLIYFKLRYSLQLLQNKVESLSRYFRTVQDRMDAVHAYHSNVNQTISYS